MTKRHHSPQQFATKFLTNKNKNASCTIINVWLSVLDLMVLKIWLELKHHLKKSQKTNINIRIYTSTATRVNMNANSNIGNMSHMYVTKQYKQY